MSDNSEFLDCISYSSSNSFTTDDSFHSVTSPLPLDISLSSIFSDVSHNFNVVHINAQSIPAHYPDLLSSFVSSNIHAILISESWLKPSLLTHHFSLPGYQLIRNDRIGKRGGGVAIYLRSHISYKFICSSSQPPASNSTENILLEVLLSNSKILLGVFYSPSLSVDYFTSFENLLYNHTLQYDHIVFMGDFNTCLLKNDSRSTKLLHLIHSFNLNSLPLNATHSSPGCSPSLLDLIIVSCPSYVAKHGQCPADAFSFHDLIYLSYKLRSPKVKPSTILLRNFAGMDREQLTLDANNLDWSIVYNANCIDNKADNFSKLLLDLYDRHAPARLVKKKTCTSALALA